jgi:hypothetical protein
VIDVWKISAITAISSFQTRTLQTPYSDPQDKEESKIEKVLEKDPLTVSLDRLNEIIQEFINGTKEIQEQLKEYIVPLERRITLLSENSEHEGDAKFEFGIDF